MMEIKIGTAVSVLPFLMVDSTDHVTGKTLLSPTVTISKNGAAPVTPTGAVSEVGTGGYVVAGNATDSDTLGPIWLHATGTNADPTDVLVAVVVDNIESDTFTAVGGIGSTGGAALPVEATSDNAGGAIIDGVTVIGTQTGTYTDTEADDTNYHVITGTATAFDWVYGFILGGGYTAASLIWQGFVNGNNDSATIQAWNGSTWDTRKTVAGNNGSTDQTETIPLLSKHTTSTGFVYIRFVTSANTNPSLHTNLMSVQKVSTTQTVGYANGAVWGAIGSGTAGVVKFINGTADTKSDTFADMITIADSVGLDKFEFTPASSVTLAATINSRILQGSGWALALGNQDINNMHVFGADVSGISTAATECGFYNCIFTTSSLQKCLIKNSIFRTGTTTLTLAGNYDFDDCRSGVAGAGSHTFAKTSGQAITAQWRDYQGGLTFSGLEVGDTLTIGGRLGTVDLGSPAGAVAIEIRGSYKALTNIGSAAVNTDGAIKGVDVASILADTAEIGTAGAGLTDLGGMSTGMKAEVKTEADTALTDYDPPTNAEMIARTMLAAAYFDPSADAVTLAATQGSYAPAKAGDAMTMTSAYDFAKGTTAMTESYAANAADPTPVQAIMAIHQMLQQFGIAGTSLTVRKLDNTTTAFVVTLDSATAPTDASRT